MGRISLFSTILVFLALGTVGDAIAHGGGLDTYGCHHDRKRGGYHCHRGQFAGRAFVSKDEMLRAVREQSGARPVPQVPAPPATKGGKP